MERNELDYERYYSTEPPKEGEMHSIEILCENKRKPGIIASLRECGIYHWLSFAGDRKTWINILFNDEQTAQLESITALQVDDEKMIDFFVDYCKAIINREEHTIDDAGRIKHYTSFEDMIKAMRFRLQLYEDRFIVFRTIDEKGNIKYESYSEKVDKVKSLIDKYWY